MRKGAGAFLRDNLEAFAVAIAMALVIRHYSLEAFRIPTGSMMPTLLGDNRADGRFGDRILVDKTIYLLRAPRRYEVAVFQYPLNRSKNFIKRIGGLPDEWLRIVDGDLWTSTDEGLSWAIARKPAGTRDELLFPYWPRPPQREDAFVGVQCWDGDPEWTLAEEDGRFSVDAGAAPSRLRFAPDVVPYPGPDAHAAASRPYVGDVRLSFGLEVARAGTVAVEIVEHGRPLRLVLGADQSYVEFAREHERHPLDVRLAAGWRGDVSFANVDGELVVGIDGKTEVFEDAALAAGPLSERRFLVDGGWMRHEIAVEATACSATITDVTVDRDVYYDVDGDPERIWKIPADHYFMLGDNSKESKDSRMWSIAQVTLAGGETIRWEPGYSEGVENPGPWRGNGDPDRIWRIAVDSEGVSRAFAGSDVVDSAGSVAWPFVSKDHLIGRAFAVFWPIHIPPLAKGPTRIKLIR